MGDRLTADFLLLFCEKNSNGTKNLRLNGKELQQRIGTRLKAEDMATVSKFLVQHSQVVDLNLCYNDICDEGFKILCEDFLSCPNNLQHLNVMSCDLTAVALKDLYSAKNTLILRTLLINGNNLGENGGNFIALLIEALPTLEYLNAAGTGQTFHSVEAVLLQTAYSQMKVLDVSRIIPQNSSCQYDPMNIAENISELFRLNKSLVEFHGQKCAFDGHDIELMLTGLYDNQQHLLQFLDLGYNNMGDFGMELLASWLKTRPNLLGLNVAGNFIRDTGAKALSMGMPFSKLRFLDISNNKIADNGIIAILNSMKKPYMLRIFFFWGNSFGHNTNKLIQRMLLSSVLVQEYIDVKIYCVDDVLYAARYPANQYKHKYYSVMDYGCPTELKIIRNQIEEEGTEPKVLIRFKHMDRFPPIIK